MLILVRVISVIRKIYKLFLFEDGVLGVEGGFGWFEEDVGFCFIGWCFCW